MNERRAKRKGQAAGFKAGPGPNNRVSRGLFLEDAVLKITFAGCSVPVLGFSHKWPVREGYYHPNRAFCDARHSG
ncbi:MAG: hypothetical protein WCC80_13365, partial [Pseudolabrys sp.]